ncbi:MAG: dynamin family protein [Treponema sp.]|nr:dynamin family protein [Treponema sp.]
MIKAQDEVLDVCDRLHTVAMEGALAKDKAEKIEAIQQSVAGQKLLVPVIGEFSSGKSTMINTILQQNVLPVAITPETSLATELHYTDGEEYAEGISEDGSATRYEISQMNQLTSDADKFRSARVYLNNQQLKSIEPLVLVDMPGFEAPKAQHNKAILEYLDKGIFYIVLMKVTDGTIQRSLLNRLREIDRLGRKFSLFLSNADVEQPSKVAEVKQICEDILSDEFGCGISVSAIDNTDAKSVTECLAGIDINALFKGLYFSATNESCLSVLEGLNYQIKASKVDAGKIQDAEDEIRRSIEKIKSTSESDIQHMKSRYSGSMVNNIINDVGDALSNAEGEIVSAVMAKSNVEHLLNEIVRSSLVQSMQQRIGEVNDSIVADFSDSVKNLSEAFRDMDIDLNYTDKIVGTMQDSFKTLMTFIPSGKSKIPSIANAMSGAGLGASFGVGLSTALATPIASTVATALGVTATAINPILGAVFVLLPTVLGGLLGLGVQKMKNGNVETQIRSKLSGEVFPQIKSKLRMELPDILQQQVGGMIEQVRARYEEMLSSQQQELEKAMQDKVSSAQAAEENTRKLEGLRTQVQSISQEIAGWRIA